MAAEKGHLLLLVHRIPFPPNKGDKIRSYHLLKHLSERYQVHLACFIDDGDDHQYKDTVSALCAETHFVDLNPTLAKLRSLPALLSDRPLSLDFYRNPGLQQWVDSVIARHAIKKIVVFSSVMAQFIEHHQARRVIDFVDVDSDKWAQYALKKAWPASWIYRREGQTLLAYERKIARDCDASLFVSQAEADLFKQLVPEYAAKTDFYNNGVDSDYFSPHHLFANPYMTDAPVIVFTGAMDYWPNVDAVQWFAQQILPEIQKRHAGALFYIVGSRPNEQVKALADFPGVHVTGSVPDVRPFIAYAAVSVAPLRIARGIQNKVLEAMSMAKTVVVSPQALEGIDAEIGTDLLLAITEQEFVEHVSTALRATETAFGSAARRKVEARYNWNANLQRVDLLLERA